MMNGTRRGCLVPAAVLAAIGAAALGAMHLRHGDHANAGSATTYDRIAIMSAGNAGRGLLGYDVDGHPRQRWSILTAPNGGRAALASVTPLAGTPGGVLAMIDLDRDPSIFVMIAYPGGCSDHPGRRSAAILHSYLPGPPSRPVSTIDPPSTPWLDAAVTAHCARRLRAPAVTATPQRIMDWMMRTVSGARTGNLPDPTGTPLENPRRRD